VFQGDHCLPRHGQLDSGSVFELFALAEHSPKFHTHVSDSACVGFCFSSVEVEQRNFYPGSQALGWAKGLQPVNTDPVETGAHFELVMVVFQSDMRIHVRYVLLVSLFQQNIIPRVVHVPKSRSNLWIGGGSAGRGLLR
jgi:hypothetical protein